MTERGDMALSSNDPRTDSRAIDYDEFVRFIAGCLEVSPASLSRGTRLAEDLGVDSVRMVELKVALSDLVGVEIAEGLEFVQAAKTIGSLHLYYCDLLQRPLPEGHHSSSPAGVDAGAKDRRTATGVPMAGARVGLRPLLPEDYRWLYALETAEEVGFRWRYGGTVPPFEVFAREIHAGVHAQFVVCPRGRSEPLGLVLAYQANMRSGTVYVGVVMAARTVGSGIGIEAVGLFMNYLFSTWSFRKVYFEALEFTYEAFASATPELVKVEGVLGEDHFYQGRYFDKYILSISREKFIRYFDELTSAIGGPETPLTAVGSSHEGSQ
ncbi:MAG: phosphopantetheine-binding protein [Acidimicrobiales bacterium]